MRGRRPASLAKFRADGWIAAFSEQNLPLASLRSEHRDASGMRARHGQCYAGRDVTSALS